MGRLTPPAWVGRLCFRCGLVREVAEPALRRRQLAHPLAQSLLFAGTGRRLRAVGGRRALRGVAAAHASRGGEVAEGGAAPGAAAVGEKRGPARARARGRAAGVPGALVDVGLGRVRVPWLWRQTPGAGVRDFIPRGALHPGKLQEPALPSADRGQGGRVPHAGCTSSQPAARTAQVPTGPTPLPSLPGGQPGRACARIFYVVAACQIAPLRCIRPDRADSVQPQGSRHPSGLQTAEVQP